MTTPTFKPFDVLEARKAYAEGRNVTEFLRAQQNLTQNTPDIIEIAYDLQAGTYIDNVTKSPTHSTLYAQEVAQILDRHITPDSSLLDIGTGELTTLSFVLKALRQKPQRTYAFDISWSRVHKGLAFARTALGDDVRRVTPFVADIGEIPLRDKSVSITTSSHALEPNGGQLSALMQELFRVTRDVLVLFEPCYEINSAQGRQRMERLGYIRNLDGVARALGGEVIAMVPIRNISNPLNPTVGFVIRPPASAPLPAMEEGLPFAVPGSNIPLHRVDDFYHAPQAGLCYPILKGIPVLKSKTAILATALDE